MKSEEADEEAGGVNIESEVCNTLFQNKYRVIQILCAYTDDCRRGLGLPTDWLAGQYTGAASKHSLCYFSLFSEQMVTRIDVHLQSEDASVY